MAQGGDMVVIFDRWHVSSWVYGLSAGMLPSKLDVISEGMLDPDITFVLDGEGFDRPELEDDAYGDDSSFQNKVRARYREHGVNATGVIHINADRDKEIIQEEIFVIAKHHLSKAAIL